MRVAMGVYCAMRNNVDRYTKVDFVTMVVDWRSSVSGVRLQSSLLMIFGGTPDAKTLTAQRPSAEVKVNRPQQPPSFCNTILGIFIWATDILIAHRYGVCIEPSSAASLMRPSVVHPTSVLNSPGGQVPSSKHNG
jgi:hypothetical protein